MDKKYTTIHYHSYLELDQILSAQNLRSAQLEENPAHEEMLFIVIHQVYELWFKQIIHEMESIVYLFGEDRTDERNLSVVNHRLDRIKEIMKLLIQQIRVLETMTPLDFLDFQKLPLPGEWFSELSIPTCSKLCLGLAG